LLVGQALEKCSVRGEEKKKPREATFPARRCKKLNEKGGATLERKTIKADVGGAGEGKKEGEDWALRRKEKKETGPPAPLGAAIHFRGRRKKKGGRGGLVWL